MEWDGLLNVMLLASLVLVLVLGILLAGLLLLAHWLDGSWPGKALPCNRRGRLPIDILDERLARGEIDRGDYDALRKILGL